MRSTASITGWSSGIAVTTYDLCKYMYYHYG